MRSWTTTSLVMLLFGVPLQLFAQTAPEQKADPTLPAPGTRGNADNVQYVGRSDPKGNAVRLAKATGHVSNYDESKVGDYKLPNPLVMNDGRPVTSAEMWFKERRPEILKFYQTEIYGRIPENTPKVKWEVTETDDKARDGTAIMKHVVGRMSDEPDGPKMNMTVLLPAKAAGPMPMILSIQFRLPAAAPAGAIPQPIVQARRVRPTKPKASANCSAAAGDMPCSLTPTFNPIDRIMWKQGVIGLTLKEGQTQPAPDEWGTISAWAWGISRAIDYLETDKAVNAKQIAITGTSRLGKTVLWAGAWTSAWRPCFRSFPARWERRSSAAIGAKRSTTWHRISAVSSLAICRNGPAAGTSLPVDQHMLIALSAPRPVYVNGGMSDQWSDPKGEVLSMVAAGPVYRLLGRQRPGRHRSAAAGPASDHWRPGLPLPQQRPHGRARRLEGVSRLRRAAF